MFNHQKQSYKKSRKKKVNYKELEKKLDRVFSEYIRLRDATECGFCVCITCGNIYFWKQLHCGHFISRAVKATRFNEINCNSQCVKCNSFRGGEHHIYRNRLIEIHGIEAVEDLENKALIGGSLSAFQLQELIPEYREKVKILMRQKL